MPEDVEYARLCCQGRPCRDGAGRPVQWAVVHVKRGRRLLWPAPRPDLAAGRFDGHGMSEVHLQVDGHARAPPFSIRQFPSSGSSETTIYGLS